MNILCLVLVQFDTMHSKVVVVVVVVVVLVDNPDGYYLFVAESGDV